MKPQFQDFMQYALQEAQNAFDADEVPIGAVIVKDQKIIACGENRTRRDRDPTAHAEIVAIRKAAQNLQNFRLEGCKIYVTLEPCAMCAAAISEARIETVFFGADDPKSGGTTHGARVFDHENCHHKPEVFQGLKEAQAQELLRKFFASKRK